MNGKKYQLDTQGRGASPAPLSHGEPRLLLSRSALCRARSVLVPVFTILLAVHAEAVDRLVGPPAPDIVVLVDPLQESGIPFGQVIADAAHYKLDSLGLEMRIDIVSPSEDANPLPRARETGAAAVLVFSYSVEGKQLAITLGWYDPGVGAATASSEGKGAMDLNLDGVIFAAMDDILGKVGAQLKAMEGRKTGQGSAADLLPAKPAAVDSPPPVLPPQNGPVAAAEAANAPAAIRLLLSGGFAPFVPTGAASSYFGMGYLPSLLVSVLVPTRAGPVGIGFYTGVDYFAAIGLTDNSDNYLIPLGLDVRYELDVGSLHPFFHLAGGPAILVMATGTQGIVVGVMPFLKSGVGMEYGITSWLGVVLVADYDIYFEMPYLIMGFSPSVNVAVRL